MTDIVFYYNEKEININCKKDETLTEICKRFSKSINKDLENFSFLHNGKELNLELPFNNFNKENKNKNLIIQVIEKNKLNSKDGANKTIVDIIKIKYKIKKI